MAAELTMFHSNTSLQLSIFYFSLKRNSMYIMQFDDVSTDKTTVTATLSYQLICSIRHSL